jgi:hypothetical protein
MTNSIFSIRNSHRFWSHIGDSFVTQLEKSQYDGYDVYDALLGNVANHLRIYFLTVTLVLSIEYHMHHMHQIALLRH